MKLIYYWTKETIIVHYKNKEFKADDIYITCEICGEKAPANTQIYHNALLKSNIRFKEEDPEAEIKDGELYWEPEDLRSVCDKPSCQVTQSL